MSEFNPVVVENPSEDFRFGVTEGVALATLGIHDLFAGAHPDSTMAAISQIMANAGIAQSEIDSLMEPVHSYFMRIAFLIVVAQALVQENEQAGQRQGNGGYL